MRKEDGEVQDSGDATHLGAPVLRARAAAAVPHAEHGGALRGLGAAVHGALLAAAVGAAQAGATHGGPGAVGHVAPLAPPVGGAKELVPGAFRAAFHGATAAPAVADAVEGPPLRAFCAAVGRAPAERGAGGREVPRRGGRGRGRGGGSRRSSRSRGSGGSCGKFIVVVAATSGGG